MPDTSGYYFCDPGLHEGQKVSADFLVTVGKDFRSFGFACCAHHLGYAVVAAKNSNPRRMNFRIRLLN